MVGVSNLENFKEFSYYLTPFWFTSLIVLTGSRRMGKGHREVAIAYLSQEILGLGALELLVALYLLH